MFIFFLREAGKIPAGFQFQEFVLAQLRCSRSLVWIAVPERTTGQKEARRYRKRKTYTAKHCRRKSSSTPSNSTSSGTGGASREAPSYKSERRQHYAGGKFACARLTLNMTATI